jgi:hypothetical protein
VNYFFLYDAIKACSAKHGGPVSDLSLILHHFSNYCYEK